MKSKENIQSGFSGKVFYFVFAFFLSVPVGIYINSSLKYFVPIRIEWVFRPASKNNKTCYRYTYKKISYQKTKNAGKNVIAYKYSLIHFTNNINKKLVLQKIRYCRMPEKRLLPPNKYHNDKEDDLMNPVLIS